MWRSTSKRPAEGRVLIAFWIALVAIHGLQAEPSPSDLVPIDLLVDRVPAGTIGADLSGRDMAVETETLFAVLREKLDEGLLERLEAASGGNPLLPLPALDAFGIGWRFDSKLLSLSLSIPPAQRKSRIVSLEPVTAGPFGKLEAPSPFSAYVNLRAKAEATLRFSASQPVDAEIPVQVSIEPVANLLGWVLEAYASADILPTWQARLDNARLVRDFPQLAARLLAGTIQAPGAEFLSPRPLLGIQFLIDPTLTGGRRKGASAAKELFLSSPAEVSVILNGDLLRRTRLDAGRYLLEDIPYRRGVNELVVKAAGNGSSDPDPGYVPYDSRLLVPGDSALSLSLGMPPWQWEPPVMSGWFLYGLNPWVTAGIQLEAGIDRQRGGAELLAATGAGNLRLAFGTSSGAGIAPDIGLLAEYQVAFPFSRVLPVLGFSARYTGERFLGPGAVIAANPDSWSFTASVGQPLPFGIGLSLAGSWRMSRTPGSDEAMATLTLTRAISRGTSLSLFLNGRLPAGSSPEAAATFLLTSSLPDGLVMTGVRNDVTGRTAGVDVQFRPGKSRDLPMFSASLDGLPFSAAESSSADFGVRYAGRAFEASLSDRFTRAGGDAPTSSNTVTMEAGTALALADGLVGLSAPIADSFALLVPVENLKGQTVVANPNPDGALAVAERGGVGTIPQLRSYSRTPLFLDAPETPPGADLGDVQRVLAPTYRSGIVVRVGTAPTFPGRGTLLLPDGVPARLLAGEAARTDAEGSTPLKFFTDEAGIFQLYGLAPGDYTMRLYAAGAGRASLRIPTEAEGPQEIGSLRLSLTEER